VAAHQADAQTCTDHALRVLRTLNALEKYSEKRWPIEPRVTDLRATCSDVATMARPMMAAGVELRTSVTLEPRASGHLQHQPSDRFLAWVDDLVLREVLLNLVQNSARFTTSGSVEFGCVIARAEKAIDTDAGVPADAPRCCRFYVRDTGTGIHGEALASLFTKYTSIGGVGIGVHLSRRQVAAMGGELIVRSPWRADGRTGTEFSFALELEPVSAEAAAAHNATQAAASSHGGTASAATATAAAPPPPPPPKLPPKVRVLIADDVLMNVRLLQAALRRCCNTWRVTAVELAGEALTLFEEARRDGDAFDLIIMDEHFDARSENMIGTDVIRRMRAIESGADGGPRRAAIISCSGNSNEDDADLSSVFLAAGADAVWAKPIPSFIDGTMQRRLAAVLGGEAQRACV
jgi:CheY-like chemotaxis protein